MTQKILAFCLVLMLAANVASAQETVKSGDVPKSVLSNYVAQTSKTAAKKATWSKTPTSFTAEYEGTSVRLDNSGNIVWTSRRIDQSEVNKDILAAFMSKYGNDYHYEWAESVTLSDGAVRTFIIAKKGDFNYYFKYNDKKLMVEKTATCK